MGSDLLDSEAEAAAYDVTKASKDTDAAEGGSSNMLQLPGFQLPSLPSPFKR
jgi:hypothetical protein